MPSDWTCLELKELEEKLYTRVIEPGLQLYVLPKTGYRKKYAVIAANFGSIDNTFKVEGRDEVVSVPDGVAHFLEHKLFEDERGNVFDRFAGLGAASNAFTAFTHTAYLFSCTDLFRENLELLLDFVQEPYFTPETVRNEQGIIGQEIRMYEDNPRWRVYFNLLAALYSKHPVRIDIAGTVESIGQITPDILYRCYRTYYHPSNMAIFVVGDLDHDEVGKQVEDNIGKRGYGSLGEIRRIYPREPVEVNNKKTTLEMVVSQPIFNLGFKDSAASRLSGQDLFRREIGMELLLEIIFGRSEPLYNDLYQEGLVDDDFDASYTAEKSYALTLIGGETMDPEALYSRVMETLARIRKEGISSEQFRRHRRNQLGSFMRRFNSLEYIANNFLAYRFRGVDLFDYPVLLQQIKQEELHALLDENLHPDQHAVSLVLPRKE